MITVHLILNAHIDPVWLWPWQAGADEVLATCRSACERLDANPDAIFTQGEAWAYDIVERIDPALFRRIRGHIEAGRWEIVGGWWVQPDCNLPSALGLQRQIDAGRAYFESRFGVFPRIGYNIDSFGHASALPGLMRANGQDRYVMMRPQPHEKTLPARLFRWRGEPDGPEVRTFRIAGRYATRAITAEHIHAALEALPDGVTHTMAFVGVGDHGGGPTERQIAWCRDNADAFDDCRLVFSSPARFFDAVEAEGAPLPLVTGELQHHAVGCYSAARRVKVAVRAAEEALGQAEIVAAADPRPEPSTGERLAAAWRTVAFNQFHDTLGGAAIPSAYEQVEAQLGGARGCADEIAQIGLRRLLADLPADPRQRIALFNASEAAFDGYAIIAPWTEARWRPHWRLLDEAGEVVPHQPIGQEAATAFPRRIVLRIKAAPKSLRLLRLDRGGPVAEPQPEADGRPNRPADLGEVDRLQVASAAVEFDPAPTLSLGAAEIAPRLELYDDPTDTWSHGVDRLSSDLIGRANWSAPRQIDDGPLLWSAIQTGAIGDSTLVAEWRLFAGEPNVELDLTVHWRARRQLLKLVLPTPLAARVDAVMGGAMERGLDGRERPLQGFSWLNGAAGTVGIVCPDVFAMDADAGGARLTLLRSPLMAHHDPAPADGFPRATPSDQGVHRFRFEFAAFEGLTPSWLDMRAAMLRRPLLTADLTNGMGPRGDW